jgi:hypothetical protein
LIPGINSESHLGADALGRIARHAGGMNIYLINALLVLLVLRQIREHQLDLRALAVPVLAVAAAAVMFLHSVPGGGSDIALDVAVAAADAHGSGSGGTRRRLLSRWPLRLPRCEVPGHHPGCGTIRM